MISDKESAELAQISFFLAKENVSYDKIFDPESGISGKKDFKSVEFVVGDIACKFFYFEATSFKKTPVWLEFINENIPSDNAFAFSSKSENPNGILLIEIDGRLLAATFGRSSSSCLSKRALESDFGIKTAMNMCGNEEIRQTKSQSNSITTTHIDRQSVRPAEAFAFGLSESEDLKYISAHIKGHKNITLQGRNNLTIKVSGDKKLDWPTLVDHCKEFLSAYKSEDYISLFPNYKNFQPATEQETSELNEALISAIKSGELDRIYLSIPEFIPDDDYGYAYSNNPIKENFIYSHLDINDLIKHIDTKKLDVSMLERKRIFAYSYPEDKILGYKKWSVYECMVFEHEISSGYFILSDGKWSKVDNEFYDSIDEFIDKRLREEPHEAICGGIDIYDPAQKKNREGVFNSEFCKKRSTAILFDTAKLKIGTGKSDKEFCDILDMTDDDTVRIINAKQFKGASSVNYLFSQAKFYGEAFLRDETFLADIRNHVAKSGSAWTTKYLSHIKESIEHVRGDHYVMCLWMLYDKAGKKPSKSDIPLISKYELKLAHDHLRRVCKYSDVIIRFIPVTSTKFTKTI